MWFCRHDCGNIILFLGMGGCARSCVRMCVCVCVCVCVCMYGFVHAPASFYAFVGAWVRFLDLVKRCHYRAQWYLCLQLSSPGSGDFPAAVTRLLCLNAPPEN